MVVNLISDTITKPSFKMLEAMFSATVGDDVFKEDPSVNKLEEEVASLFGKEAALFFPSGTMTNQTAIMQRNNHFRRYYCSNKLHFDHTHLQRPHRFYLH